MSSIHDSQTDLGYILLFSFVVSFYQISWAIVGVSNDNFIMLNVRPEYRYLTHEKCQ